jgi:hypothetical protein
VSPATSPREARSREPEGGQARSKCWQANVHAHPGAPLEKLRPQPAAAARTGSPTRGSRRIGEHHRVTHGEQRSRATGTRAAHLPGSSATSSRPAPLATGASLTRLFCASTASPPPTSNPFLLRPVQAILPGKLFYLRILRAGPTIVESTNTSDFCLSWMRENGELSAEPGD